MGPRALPARLHAPTRLTKQQWASRPPFNATHICKKIASMAPQGSSGPSHFGASCRRKQAQRWRSAAHLHLPACRGVMVAAWTSLPTCSPRRGVTTTLGKDKLSLLRSCARAHSAQKHHHALHNPLYCEQRVALAVVRLAVMRSGAQRAASPCSRARPRQPSEGEGRVGARTALHHSSQTRSGA